VLTLGAYIGKCSLCDDRFVFANYLIYDNFYFLFILHWLNFSSFGILLVSHLASRLQQYRHWVRVATTTSRETTVEFFA
jgi:hypothetical protein